MIDNQQLDAAREFLKNRRAPTQAVAQAVSQNSNNDVNAAREFLQNRRLQNQGANPSSQPEKSSFNYYKFLADSVAKGLISYADLPAAVTNILYEMSPPPLPGLEKYDIRIPAISPKIESGIKNLTGYEIGSEKPTTAFQRILGHATEFGSGMLGPSAIGAAAKLSKVPSLIKASQFLGAPTAATKLGKAKELSKAAAVGAGIGTVSGAAQEVGVDPLIADVISAVATPMAIKGATNTLKFLSPQHRQAFLNEEAGKKLAERLGPERVAPALKNIENYTPSVPGYQGTTAEQAKTVGLSQLQNSRTGIVPEISFREAKDNQALQKHLEKINRNKEVVEEFGYRVEPEQAGSHIQQELAAENKANYLAQKEASSPLYKELEEFKPLIVPESTYDLLEKLKKTAKGDFASDLVNIEKQLVPNHLGKQGVKLPYGFHKFSKHVQKEILSANRASTAQELYEITEQLQDMVTSATKQGAYKRARRLGEIRNSLFKDLENTPADIARKTHREGFEPINEIERNKSLGKAVEQDIFSKEFVADKGQVAKGVLEKAMSSDQYAENLLPHIQKKPGAMMMVRGFVNDNLLNKVIHSQSGEVIIPRLASWRQSNKGALKLFPELDGQLNNLQKQGLMDKLYTSLETSPIDALDNKMVSYQTMRDFLKGNKKALREVFSPQEMKVFGEVEKALRGRAKVKGEGRSVGSDTAANLSIMQNIFHSAPTVAVKAFGLATGHSALTNLFVKGFTALKRKTVDEIIDRSLTDPKLFTLLMTPLKDVRPTKTNMQLLSDIAKTATQKTVKGAVTLPIKKELMDVNFNENQEE